MTAVFEDSAAQVNGWEKLPHGTRGGKVVAFRRYDVANLGVDDLL